MDKFYKCGIWNQRNDEYSIFTAANGGNAPVAATVNVRATVDGCEGPPTSFTITVNPTPTVADPTDQVVCNNSSTTAVTFSGAVSGTTFNWTNDNPSIGLDASGSGNIAAFTATNNGTTAVIATITVTPKANGCTGVSQAFTITVKPSPTVDDPTDQAVCDNTFTTAVTFTGSGTTLTGQTIIRQLVFQPAAVATLDHSKQPTPVTLL
jgi:hypothetical protein